MLCVWCMLKVYVFCAQRTVFLLQAWARLNHLNVTFSFNAIFKQVVQIRKSDGKVAKKKYFFQFC